MYIFFKIVKKSISSKRFSKIYIFSFYQIFGILFTFLHPYYSPQTLNKETNTNYVRYLTNDTEQMFDMRLYLSFRKIENEIYGA